MKTLLLVSTFLLPSSAGAAVWEGRKLTEVRSLAALPKPMRDALGAGIADRKEKFNPTDQVDPKLPMSRFVLAGTDGRSALAAVERGGRGYHVEVLFFEEAEGAVVVKRRWTVFEKPKNLAALIRAISTVTREQADAIAREYFALHVGCGSYTGISDSPDAWIVEGKFGFAGEPIKGFTIDKRAGRITSTVGPSYADREDMRRNAPK